MTKLVGILNITPDSFSDGGLVGSPEAALIAVQHLIDVGADVVDVGAESTRPDATALTAEEEWLRLEPVLGRIISLCHKAGCEVSLDTRHPQNAARAIALNVDMINDVSGASDEMCKVMSGHNAALVVMHSLSVPVDKNLVIAPHLNVIDELIQWFRNKQQNIVKYDIPGVIFDPGIGFGKSAKQSLELLARWRELNVLDVPIYVGHSRKSFMKLLSDAPAHERDDLTLAFSALLMAQGVDYLRVHEVARHKQLQEVLT